MSEKVKIIFKKGERAGDSIAFSPPTIFIGRAKDNDICFQTETVSLYHAEITTKDNKWYLQDKKSSNGTKLNGIKISGKSQLKSRDLIYTGTEVFMVEFSAPIIEVKSSNQDDGTIKIRGPHQKRAANTIAEEAKEVVVHKRHKAKPANNTKNDKAKAERRIVNRLIQQTLQEKKRRLSKIFISVATIINIAILLWWLSNQGYDFPAIINKFLKR